MGSRTGRIPGSVSPFLTCNVTRIDGEKREIVATARAATGAAAHCCRTAREAASDVELGSGAAMIDFPGRARGRHRPTWPPRVSSRDRPWRAGNSRSRSRRRRTPHRVTGQRPDQFALSVGVGERDHRLERRRLRDVDDQYVRAANGWRSARGDKNGRDSWRRVRSRSRSIGRDRFASR